MPAVTETKLDSIATGREIEIDFKHALYDGPSDMKERTRKFLELAKIEAGPDILLDLDDWTLLLDRYLSAHGFTRSEARAILDRSNLATPLVFNALRDARDPNLLPNALSRSIDPVFNRLFPFHSDLFNVPEAGLPGDKNVFKKTAMALFYAMELYSLEATGKRTWGEAERRRWVQGRLEGDLRALRTGIRERMLEKVGLEEQDDYYRRFFSETGRAVTWDRLMQWKLDPRTAQAYRWSARNTVQSWFPYLSELRDADVKLAPMHGSLFFDGMYRSLTSFALANGMSPAQLSAYGQVLRDVFLPEIRAYWKDATLKEVAQLPESTFVRVLTRRLEVSKDPRTAVQVKVEAERIKGNLMLTDVLYWSQKFMRDFGIEPGGRITGAQKAGMRRSFGSMMGRISALRGMPEIDALIREQQGVPRGEKINWFLADTRGLLSAVVQDWSKEGWTPNQVRAHLRNSLVVTGRHLKDMENYYRLIGRPMSFDLKSRDELHLKRVWGELGGFVRTLEKMNEKVALTPDEISRSIRGLVKLQEAVLAEKARLEGELRELEAAGKTDGEAERLRFDINALKLESGQDVFLFKQIRKMREKGIDIPDERLGDYIKRRLFLDLMDRKSGRQGAENNLIERIRAEMEGLKVSRAMLRKVSLSAQEGTEKEILPSDIAETVRAAQDFADRRREERKDSYRRAFADPVRAREWYYRARVDLSRAAREKAPKSPSSSTTRWRASSASQTPTSSSGC